MSLLGFNAVGRVAIGQISQSSGAFVLVGATASYLATASAASFTTNEAAVGASYAVVGGNALFLAGLNAGSYTLTGSPVAASVSFAVAASSYRATGGAAVLTRDYVNWLRASSPSGAWTAKAAPSSTWTSGSVPSSSWAVDPAQQIQPSVSH